MSTRDRHQDELVVTDARAIKALAHPARLTVIDELYSGRVLTSSELAEIAGLTPSAMSYHLRAMERWGVVKRAEPRADGRERPWQATGSALGIRTDEATTGQPASPSAKVSQTMIALEYVDRLRDGLARWMAMSTGDPWERSARIRSGHLYLTREEAEGLTAELDEILDRYRIGHHAGARRPGTRRTNAFLALYPVESPTDGEG